MKVDFTNTSSEAVIYKNGGCFNKIDEAING
jgi:predicted acetyltransferase